MIATLHNADCRDILPSLADVDAVVCDPPYELDFMGAKWDRTGIAYDATMWKLVLAAMKPGAHLLAFGGSRTYHRLACAIEDAGFEIRDQIMWIYGTGYPKNRDVSKAIDKAAGAEREISSNGLPFGSGSMNNRTRVKQGYRPTEPNPDGGVNAITAPATAAAKQWQGWGSALKPAHEPLVLARKPLVGTIAANVQAYGTGAMNIDGCRVQTDEDTGRTCSGGFGSNFMDDEWSPPSTVKNGGHVGGRWPANLLHDGSDEVLEAFAAFGEKRVAPRGPSRGALGYQGADAYHDPDGVRGYADTGTAARFFYCAKASKEDRGEGNAHPTVKPTALMRWLCRLVTPPGGLVLDPFMGSGSTGKAAILEGFRFVGIENDTEHGYFEMAKARIDQEISLRREEASRPKQAMLFPG